MSTIHDDLSITLDGINPFVVGSDTYSWRPGNPYTTLGNVTILGTDPGQAYDVDINFAGQDWSVDFVLSIGGQSIDTITMSGFTPHNTTGIYEAQLTAQTSTYIDLVNASIWRLVISGSSDNTVRTGWDSMQWMLLGDGDDTVVTSTTYVESFGTSAGADTITLGGYSLVDFLRAGDDDDIVDIGNYSRVGQLQAGNGNDTVTLIGDASAITIDGGAGTDTLIGGNKDDLFVIKSAADHAVGEVINGGAGTADTISFMSKADEMLTLTAGVASIEFIRTYPTYSTGSKAGIDASALTYGTTLLGDQGTNTIVGSAYADVIEGGGEVDKLTGAGGNDTFIIAAAGHHVAGEVINGGVDLLDRIRFTSTVANETLTLTSGVTGVEIIEITSAAGAANGTTTLGINATALIYGANLKGNAGVNTMLGSAYADVIEGNGGNDVLDGRGGADTIRGGDGNDVIQVLFGVHHLSTEIIDGGAGAADRIRFLASNAGDTLTLSNQVTNVEIIEITNAAGSPGGITALNINAFALTYGATLNGNGGVNTIYGSAFNDTINGNAGNDTIEGSVGSDILRGGDGNDVFLIKSSSEHTVTELLDGGVGTTDRIRFTSTTVGQTLTLSSQVTGVEFVDIASPTGSLGGTAQLNVNASALTAGIAINGNAGNNTLTGSAFVDTINGNGGNDTINGGAGSDTLDGGAGNDVFRFTTALGAANIDTINAYTAADDRIEIDNAVFTALADGWLFSSAFTANTSGLATTASQRIIYETDTGKLFYDSNGSTAGGVYQQFAQLAAGLTMTASEFLVI